MESEKITNYLSSINIPDTNNRPTMYGFADMRYRQKEKTLNSDILNVVYPIGSLYWTADVNFNPNISFNEGVQESDKRHQEWVRICGTFVYACDITDSIVQLPQTLNSYITDPSHSNQPSYKYVDDKKTLDRSGQSEITLGLENLPAHSHAIDPNIKHGHEIRTKGDDYNASGGFNANFAFDQGDKVLVEQNKTNGAEIIDSTTNIVGTEKAGNEDPKAFETMPPYIKRCCWQRIQ